MIGRRQGVIQFVFHLLSHERIRGLDSKPVRASAEIVDLLPNVQRNEDELAVIKIAPAFEDPGNFEFGGKNHLFERRGACLVALLFNPVELVENLVEVARRDKC